MAKAPDLDKEALLRGSVEERRERGRRARKAVPRSSHSEWKPPADRRDVVALLEEQDQQRDPDLVPVRHGRMMVSAFTFYRGAARIMAADLPSTPASGLNAQLCGDAHLSNFGVFAAPSRDLLFDLNDFDETLPGPWEWDLKRLAASFVIAARHREFDSKLGREACMASVRSYREAMAQFAQMGTMKVWYQRLKADDIKQLLDPAGRKRLNKGLKKARGRDSVQALSKLTEMVDGAPRFLSDPPAIVPARDWLGAYWESMSPGTKAPSEEELVRNYASQLEAYGRTLQPDRRLLLERFETIDVARRASGVGSVGTRTFVVLMMGRDENDPLVLQVKQAGASVLEEFLGESAFAHPGERVVQGQRMMQAASDSFLGWTDGVMGDKTFYWRQLKDGKGSVDPDTIAPEGLVFYASLCGWTLARAHARTGDPIALAAYLGKSETLDTAIAEFSEAYADQNETDFRVFMDAIGSGRLEALEGV